MVSCADELEARARAAPERRAGAGAVTRLREPAIQQVRTGSFVEVPHDPALRPADGLAVCDLGLARARAPARDGAARFGRELGTAGRRRLRALALDPDGRPCFEVAARDGRGSRSPRGRCRSTRGGDSRGCSTRRADRIAVEPLRPSPATSSTAVARRPGSPLPARFPGPLLIGAERRGPDAEASAHLDGKLEQPTVRAGPPGRAAGRRLGAGRGPRRPRWPTAGRWGFTAAASTGPLRAVTGRRLERRRARLALRRRGLRGDALPLRRRRRPRLGAGARARDRRAAARAASTRSCSCARRTARTWSRSSSAGRRTPSRRPTRCCCPTLHLPRLFVRARRAGARPAPSRPEDRWVARNRPAQPLRPPRRWLSASTRLRCCGR